MTDGAHELGRCSGAVSDEGVLSGCPDYATTVLHAVGTLAHDGDAFDVALCAEHAELAGAGGGATLTLTVIGRA